MYLEQSASIQPRTHPPKSFPYVLTSPRFQNQIIVYQGPYSTARQAWPRAALAGGKASGRVQRKIRKTEGEQLVAQLPARLAVDENLAIRKKET